MCVLSCSQASKKGPRFPEEECQKEREGKTKTAQGKIKKFIFVSVSVPLRCIGKISADCTNGKIVSPSPFKWIHALRQHHGGCLASTLHCNSSNSSALANTDTTIANTHLDKLIHLCCRRTHRETFAGRRRRGDWGGTDGTGLRRERGPGLRPHSLTHSLTYLPSKWLLPCLIYSLQQLLLKFIEIK